MLLASLQTKKIAFLIIAHDDAEHLKKLVRSLSGHDVYIHWDKKSGPEPDIDGAQFISERSSVFWAGFSAVEATVALMEAALGSKNEYIKYVLLSGADYPIRPMSSLVDLFEGDGGWNYINAIEVEASPHLSKLVSKRLWRDGVFPAQIKRSPSIKKVERYVRGVVNLVLQHFPKRKIDYALYHGSQWWALSPEAVKTALDCFHNDATLRAFYRFTFASDEQFFQTCIRNSRLAPKCDAPLPYEGRGTYQTANLHIVDRSLSKWFTIEDQKRISDSGKFFVRKLRSLDSSELVEWLDKRLSPPTDV